MSTAIHPARYLKAAGVIGTVLTLLFVFMVARVAPLWLLQVGMFAALSGALAWPPKTFRIASVWVLWLGTAVSLVWSLSVVFRR